MQKEVYQAKKNRRYCTIQKQSEVAEEAQGNQGSGQLFVPNLHKRIIQYEKKI